MFGLQIDLLTPLTYETANPPMENDIPEYEGSGASILVPYLAEIEALRAKRWPYREISKWLSEKHNLDVAYNTICDFCKNRGITKGGATSVSKPRNASQPGVSPSKEEIPASASSPSVRGDTSLDLLAEAQERVAQQQSNPFRKITISKEES